MYDISCTQFQKLKNGPCLVVEIYKNKTFNMLSSLMILAQNCFVFRDWWNINQSTVFRSRRGIRTGSQTKIFGVLYLEI